MSHKPDKRILKRLQQWLFSLLTLARLVARSRTVDLSGKLDHMESEGNWPIRFKIGLEEKVKELKSICAGLLF